MQLWPYYMVAVGVGCVMSACVSRVLFIGFLTFMCGLLAMRFESSFPPLYALTVWSVAAAIVYSTNQPILTAILTVIVAVCYIPALFGMKWYYAAASSDVAGIAAVASLFISLGMALVGFDRGGSRLMHPGPLPAWPREALAALVSAQKSAPTEAVEREW